MWWWEMWWWEVWWWEVWWWWCHTCWKPQQRAQHAWHAHVGTRSSVPIDESHACCKILCLGSAADISAVALEQTGLHGGRKHHGVERKSHLCEHTTSFNTMCSCARATQGHAPVAYREGSGEGVDPVDGVRHRVCVVAKLRERHRGKAGEHGCHECHALELL